VVVGECLRPPRQKSLLRIEGVAGSVLAATGAIFERRTDRSVMRSASGASRVPRPSAKDG
jgi:hypothetical protein